MEGGKELASTSPSVAAAGSQENAGSKVGVGLAAAQQGLRWNGGVQLPVLPDKELSMMEKLRDEGSGALTWWMTGMTTYLVLYMLGRTFLLEQAALDGLRAMVPPHIYDRSTFIFITALALDVLNMIFERHSIKMDFVLYPAFIKGMASITNVLNRWGSPIVAFSTTGRYVMLQRYLCWMHTTPTMLIVIRLISTSITVREAAHVIIWDEIMLVSGAAALMTTGWMQVFMSVLTHAAFVPILPYFCKGFYEAATSLKTGSARGIMWVILAVNMAIWTFFAVTWNLALWGLISVKTEECLYLICDFTGKVMFSSTLMLSSFKGMEARRETAMRNIEDSSKQKLIEELKRLLEQKERFMSSVSHELRTPLNGIIGISEGMLSGCCGVMPEQVRQQICIIRTSGARLLALINCVMDAAALRQNKLVLKQEVVMLRHVVEDVLDLTRSLVNPALIELRNTVSPRITVVGDAGRIVQILNNLVGNAAKFTEKGVIKVSARSFDAGKRVAVMVQDTGMGIPKGKLATIFLPFEQVDMSVSRKYGGFGLGLNIVQDLVKAHGGEIWAESTEGKGSTFIFTMVSAQGKMLPDLYGGIGSASQSGDSAFDMHHRVLEKAVEETKSKSDVVRVRGLLRETASELLDSSTVSQGPDGSTSTDTQHQKLALSIGTEGDESNRSVQDNTWNPDGSMSPANSGPVSRARVFHHQYCGRYQVMSVDDDQINQNVVCSIFNSSGFEVLPFSGGKEALHHLATCMVLPDLVLLDCLMPVMDGFEVLRRLRAMSPSMHLPVIMVSARAEEENIVMGLSSGADDYVTKPIRQAELLARAKCHLASESSSEKGAPSLPSTESGSSMTPSTRSKHSYKKSPEVSVLCVDDDEVSQLLVSGLLQPEHWRHIAVKTAQEAMQYIRQHRQHLPDLVLLDASLPDGSGFDLCKEIRERYSRNKVPIIMLSAYHNEESIVEGLNAGANDYVSKPFKRQELLARMRMHLRHLIPSGGPGRVRDEALEAAVAEAKRSQMEGHRAGLTAAAVNSHTLFLSSCGASSSACAAPSTQQASSGMDSELSSQHAAGQPIALDHPPTDATSSPVPAIPTPSLPPPTATPSSQDTTGPALRSSPGNKNGPGATNSPATSKPSVPIAFSPPHTTSPTRESPAPTLSSDLPNQQQQQTGPNAASDPSSDALALPHPNAKPQAADDGAPPPSARSQGHGRLFNEAGTTSSGLDPGVQGTWGCAGVLVASVHRWNEFSRSVPERELGAVMQTLVTVFEQMAESMGLVMLEATGRTFSAATLYQHTHTQLNPLSAVALLQLAQGLMDAAAEVHLPPAYQPLPLQLVLHCGHVSTNGGVASGDALRVARDLLASTPPFNIVSSTTMVEWLTSAGMSHPLHALPTNAEDLLWVVEVHAAASQVTQSFPAVTHASSLDGALPGMYALPTAQAPLPISNSKPDATPQPAMSHSSGSAASVHNGVYQASIGSNIPPESGGNASIPHPFRGSIDLQRGNPAASLPMALVHPFRGSIDVSRGMHGGSLPGSLPPAEFPGNGGSNLPVHQRLSPSAAAALNSFGFGGSAGVVPPQSFRRSMEMGQGMGGLSAEQQLMVLREEITLIRQQMENLNSGKGRSTDNGSTGLSPSSSRAQLMQLTGDLPSTSQGGGMGSGLLKHQTTGSNALVPNSSMRSVSGSGKREKGSVSRFFSNLANPSKSKKGGR